MITAKEIAKLRKETKAGIMDCREALTKSKGNFTKAKDYLLKKGLSRAAKKKDRATNAGMVYSYIHHSAQAGCILSLSCETDFVARTKEFEALAKELGMQVVAMKPKNVKDLLSQDYIRDSGKKIQSLLDEAIAKLGENIKIVDFCRLEI